MAELTDFGLGKLIVLSTRAISSPHFISRLAAYFLIVSYRLVISFRNMQLTLLVHLR
jgi:hypothetical protein